MTGEERSWKTARGDTVRVWLATDGWRWHVRAANGEIVEQGEAHTRAEDAERAASRYHAPVEDQA